MMKSRSCGAAVGEQDGGLIVIAKEPEHVGRERAVEIGAPESGVVRGVLDDRTRVANQRGVDPKLLGRSAEPADTCGPCRGPVECRPGRRGPPRRLFAAARSRPDPEASRPRRAPGSDIA